MAPPQPIHGPRAAVRLRQILIPSEHGSWGFLLEPIATALILVPSGGGALLAAGVICAFLARHPARLASGDLARGSSQPRTRVALGWAIGLTLAAGAAFGSAAAVSGALVLAPLALAAVPAFIAVRLDFAYRGRELLPELLAPAVLATAAPAIVLAGGWEAPAAAALWLLLAARQLPAVLYVRARLRLERGEAAGWRLPVTAHLVAIAVGVALALAGQAPWLANAALALLLARAGVGLSAWRRPAPARRIGFAELGYGALTVALYVTGYLTAR
jgi:hypothetical protein